MAVGSLGAAGIGAGASLYASGQQADAAKAGLNFQKDMYAKNSGNLQPWITQGTQAGGTLASLFGLDGSNGQGTSNTFNAFTNLPSYQFPFQQGLQALTRQLNASGKNLSGAQVRASEQFGQGLASQYFMSNFVNPLFSMYGTGKDAAANLAGVGTTAANNVAGSYGNLGQANASGTVGAGNALGGGFQGGANNLALYSALGRNPSTGAGYSSYAPMNLTGGGPGNSNLGLENFNSGAGLY